MHIPDKDSSSSEILHLLYDNEILSMIPELAKAIHTFIVIPATERTFNSLHRLKTYVARTCGQERLSTLALLHIEAEFLNRVLREDIDLMVDMFGERAGCHSQFF